MNKLEVGSTIEIANIHRDHLNYALEKLQPIFPISSVKIKELDKQEFLLLELLTSRFSKLQDFIGSKMIDTFLECVGEPSNGLTMIDKINKLEKFQLIENADEWMIMRQLHNHLSHEYPNQPDLTAEYLNQTYNMSKKLKAFSNKIINEIKNCE